MNNIYELFQQSKTYKQQIDEKISNRISQYNGEPYGNEREGRSKIVWKLGKKQIKTLVSNIVKQFTGSPSIVRLSPIAKNDEYKAKIDERLINFFYDKEIDNVSFNKRLALITAKEGTCVVKVGWRKRTKKEKILVTDEEANQLINQGLVLEKENDTWYKINIVENKPTLEIIPNEDVYTDPLAYEQKDLRYIFIRKEVTKEDLLSNPILDKEKVQQWINEAYKSKDVGSENDLHNREMWEIYLEEEPKKDEIDTKVSLYEFWYKKDGQVKVKYLIFDGGETKVFAEKNIEFDFLPFVFFNLDVNEFSVWGDGLIDLIEDEQKFMTSIIRGVIDNMALSNNGIKFIKKGSLDPVNFNRLIAGEPVVEINTTAKLSDVMVDGSFNELPSSVYNMLQIIEQQAEGLTGISRAMQGVDMTMIKSPASNFGALMNQAQIRLYDFILSFQAGWKRIFYMWLKYAMKYLSDDEIFERTGISIPDLKYKTIMKLSKKYNLDKLPNDTKQKALMLIEKEVFDIFNKEDIKYDVKFRIGTDALTQIKISQLNMLMQQLIPVASSGSIPGDIINKLLAKLAELLEFPEIADEIENYKPQPNPMQQQMMKLEMLEKQAKAQKEIALAKNALARTQNVAIKTQKEALNAQVDIADKAGSAKLKEAQAQKLKADAVKTIADITKSKAEALKILKETNERTNAKTSKQ